MKEHVKQIGTEGVLNFICDRYSCNSRSKTVSIQNLIKYHNPKQQSELLLLIDLHQKGKQLESCGCGCKSNGTVATFAQNLFNAYNYHRNKHEPDIDYKDYDDCYTFMYYLFVSSSLRGNKMENVCLRYIDDWVKGYFTIELANEKYDFNYAIDLVLKDLRGNEIAGIQVKPHTYKNFPKTHHIVNDNLVKNKAYGKPVVYMYYLPDGKFDEIEVFRRQLYNVMMQYVKNK